LALNLEQRDPGDRGAQFSNEELLTAYREKFDSDRIEESIVSALDVRKTCHHPVGPLAALHYLFAEKDHSKADAFYEEWATGRAKKARAPSRYLQTNIVRRLRYRPFGYNTNMARGFSNASTNTVDWIRAEIGGQRRAEVFILSSIPARNRMDQKQPPTPTDGAVVPPA
jgi:hypothetical protein